SSSRKTSLRKFPRWGIGRGQPLATTLRIRNARPPCGALRQRAYVGGRRRWEGGAALVEAQAQDVEGYGNPGLTQRGCLGRRPGFAVGSEASNDLPCTGGAGFAGWRLSKP